MKKLIIFLSFFHFSMFGQTGDLLVKYSQNAESFLNQFWIEKFNQKDLDIKKPVIMFYTKGLPVNNACGSTDADNCFYCTGDNSISVSLNFIGDVYKKSTHVGILVTVAHEYGHLIQNQYKGEFNTKGIAVLEELRADCLAGVFFNNLEKKRLLAKGDYENALIALDSFGSHPVTLGDPNNRNNHGSGEHRIKAFETGYSIGSVNKCYSKYSISDLTNN